MDSVQWRWGPHYFGHKDQPDFTENVEEYLKTDSIPRSTTYQEIISKEQNRYLKGINEQGNFEDEVVAETKYKSKPHPLVGRPMCGVFYCNGARLCLASRILSQFRIKRKLRERYKDTA